MIPRVPSNTYDSVILLSRISQLLPGNATPLQASIIMHYANQSVRLVGLAKVASATSAESKIYLSRRYLRSLFPPCLRYTQCYTRKPNNYLATCQLPNIYLLICSFVQNFSCPHEAQPYGPQRLVSEKLKSSATIKN